ncbi:MAG: 4-phosphopantoate--beta-alanine ligase [Thermoplasmata archaeon]
MTDIPRNHPRYFSLITRERIVKGVQEGITSQQGLIAQGRGEAFDYLLGEETTQPAIKAVEAASALLLIARYPVININGNAAALCAKEMVELADALSCPIEVNLFHRTEERVRKIVSLLQSLDAKTVYGLYPDERIPGLQHERAKTSRNGTFSADVVFVPLEDGDRTEALKAMGKKVITVDLNPYSRTARHADITIVDNIVRAVPLLVNTIMRIKKLRREELNKIISGYSNTEVLEASRQIIYKRLKKMEQELE